MNVGIYVPTGSATYGIVARSGIVGSPDGHGRVTCYYEGNLYGSENLKRFRERLMVAAGRLAQRSPTVAVVSLPEDALRRVGTYDTGRWCVAEVEAADALAAWAGEPIEAIAGHRFAAGPLDPGAPGVRETLEQLTPVRRDGLRSLWRSIAGQTIEHRPDRPQAFAVVVDE